MAVYVSKSDIEALIKDLKKISTDNDNVKKNIDSAIKDIEKQSYDAKDDQLTKLKDIKKKLDQQVSTANEMVKIFLDAHNGFFTIDNNFKKKAAEIAITGGIAGISVNENPSVTTKDEKTPEKSKQEQPAGTATNGEPAYVLDSTAERNKITSEMTNGTYVGVNGKVDGTSTSCVWISNKKLVERGKLSGPTPNTIGGFSDSQVEIGNSSYLAWKAQHPEATTMASSTEGYLMSLVKEKGELYNVYVTSGNNNHTVLLDKVFLDDKGKLKYTLSENWGKGDLINVPNNSSHISSLMVMPLGQQQTVTASSRSGWWVSPGGTPKPAATEIYVFGK